MSPIFMLPRISIIITKRCNLKCKLCAEYAPYYKNPPQASFEEIKNAIDILFKTVDCVNDLSIVGGEIFLHKDLYDIVIYLNNYIDRAKRVILSTNGSILPAENEFSKILLFPKLKEKLQINISDYGPSLSKEAGKIELLCKKHGVKCRTISYYGDNLFCDGWVDYGDHSQKYFSVDEITAHAQKCNFRKDIYSCLNFENGNVYFSRCGRTYWRYKLGITALDTKDIVHFPKEITDTSISLLRDDIKRCIEAKYSDSCAFCNGMCEDSPRYKPAEQLTVDEIKQIKQGE